MSETSIPINVTVVIPTLTRPRPLARALASIVKQDLPLDLVMQIVVVDNSIKADARDSITSLIASIGVSTVKSLSYVSAPKPGVATARNAGVSCALGDWVAFLDDDEEAAPTWLASLVDAARDSDADAVFGPVLARSEDGSEMGPLARFFSRTFDRPAGADITGSAAYLGTNNSLFSRQALAAMEGPFDSCLDAFGGEDSLLLMQMAAAGRRFVWAPHAAITEWVPSRRKTWSYVKRRRFRSGQIRTSVVHRMSPRPAGVAFWMGLGLAQCVLAGIGAVFVWPISRNHSLLFQAAAWGGAGKVFWGKRFSPCLYGTGLVS